MRSMLVRSDPMTNRVWHYNGVDAVRRDADFSIAGDRFILAASAGDILDERPLNELQPRDVTGTGVMFGLKGRPGWRIDFENGVPDAIASLLPAPQLYGRIIDRFGLWPAIGVSAVVASITVYGFLQTPALVARAVPPSVERKLGDLMVGDLGGRTCDAGNGPEALAALVERIDANDAAIDVRVVNLPIANAVTLPGGRIVVFDGLVRAAKSPDELAGVIGHEIGHAKHRDVMESLLRQVGLSVLLGGLDGNIGGYTNTLLASSYSRGAETRADQFSITALKTTRISPIPTADFFRRLSGNAKESGSRIAQMTNYLSSHPVSSDRAVAFAGSAKGPYTPALDTAQWQALRSICADDRDVEKPRFRF